MKSIRIASGECLGGACDRCDVPTPGTTHVLIFTGAFGHIEAHLCEACGETDFVMQALAK